jgi:hypothetical protein
MQPSYRRWPTLIPRLNAFWRIAPGVRFISFEILTTAVLFFVGYRWNDRAPARSGAAGAVDAPAR